MPKDISANLQSHLDQEATTLTTLWEITRTDGVVIRLTELDEDVEFEGNTFLSAFGFSRTAISSEEGLRSDTFEVETILSSEAIDRRDILIGLYNFADIRLYLINFEAPEDGAIRLKRGRLGEVLLSSSDKISVEVQSLSNALVADIVEKTSPTCRVNVGSARCMVPIDVLDVQRSTDYREGDFVRVAVAPGTLDDVYGNLIFECTAEGTTGATEPSYATTIGAETVDGSATFAARQSFTRHGSVTGATSSQIFTVSVSEPRSVDGWFSLGRLKFQSGPNQGFEREIKTWISPDTVELFEPMPSEPQAGDAFTISPGCDKLRSTCRNKWVIPGSLNFDRGNVINFQGEPDLPGRDVVLTYPDAQ